MQAFVIRCGLGNGYGLSEGDFSGGSQQTVSVVADEDIEKLNAHIAEIVIKQHKLREAIDEIVADLEGGAL